MYPILLSHSRTLSHTACYRRKSSISISIIVLVFLSKWCSSLGLFASLSSARLFGHALVFRCPSEDLLDQFSPNVSEYVHVISSSFFIHWMFLFNSTICTRNILNDTYSWNSTLFKGVSKIAEVKLRMSLFCVPIVDSTTSPIMIISLYYEN